MRLVGDDGARAFVTRTDRLRVHVQEVGDAQAASGYAGTETNGGVAMTDSSDKDNVVGYVVSSRYSKHLGRVAALARVKQSLLTTTADNSYSSNVKFVVLGKRYGDRYALLRIAAQK